MTGDGYKNTGSDFNVGEADTGEDVLDEASTSNGGLVGDRTGIDTDAYNERAEWLERSSIGVGEGVDEGPYYAVGFELVTDARTDVNPCRLDGVAINWTRFTDDVLARRTLCGLFRADLYHGHRNH